MPSHGGVETSEDASYNDEVTMTLEQKLANAFALHETVWMRHANPWSVWTRHSVLPLLILAVWSRVWLGWWALIPSTVAVMWMWLNPRIFSKPHSTKNWASKAVFGERVWLNRNQIPVPLHHQTMPNLLSAVAASGMIFVIWGMIELAIWPTLLGTVLIYLGKLWFLDRMVWLYEDMKDVNSEYSSWLY